MATKYSQERKDSVIKKMLPPSNMSVSELVKLENIPYGTLFTWKQQYLNKNPNTMSSILTHPTERSASQKLAIIIETSLLTEQERSEYCRKHGLLTSDIQAWKKTFTSGKVVQTEQVMADKNELKKLRNENLTLKKELTRKEKALAETAALLVLRKKLDALWEENEDA